MLKKTITYTDYNGLERTEDFYFNISEAELAEMELGTTGGYGEMLKLIVATHDVPALAKIFKELVLKAYGVKSADGRQFIKSEQLSTEFSQTEAYVKLYMEMARDANKAADFVNAIIPSHMSKKPEAAVLPMHTN